MEFTKEKIENFAFSSKREWLLSNGIGGFASSTIIGLNTRKYHALLVAALGDFGERFVTLSRLNESIEIEGKSQSISTNECHNFLEYGYKRQEIFRKDYLPEFEYKIEDTTIQKIIAMKYGENKVSVVYKIKTGKNDIIFRLQPLVNFRKFHDVRRCYYLDSSFKENAVNIKLNSHQYVLHMNVCVNQEPCIFEKYDRTYYHNMFYRQEEERGLDAYEDHFMPGEYAIPISKNKECTVEFVASVDSNDDFMTINRGMDIIRREITRLEKVCKIANAQTEIQKELAISADSFIVTRGKRKTLLAGFPWFGDWGRDTFIAFEGILLKTNRFKDAKEIILSFANHIKNGLIPNFIGENGGESYNTVDASLWYIDAVYKYYKYTFDASLVKDIYPFLMQIINAYQEGTEFDIKMDKEDCLIHAGNERTQLTWMDAKVGDIIPTPRGGKPVEINALWYNALKEMEELTTELNLDFDLNITFDASISKKVKESFQKFYAADGLYDVIEPNSNEIRPNQIFAIGLLYPVVDDDKAKEILNLVEEKLYTKEGLKTLCSDHDDYRPFYKGDVYQRDISYHQGTVWPWLLMPYFEASKRFGGKYKKLEDIEKMLTDDCIGSISEIYDAEMPREAKGAFSQAWSVAMALLNS